MGAQRRARRHADIGRVEHRKAHERQLDEVDHVAQRNPVDSMLPMPPAITMHSPTRKSRLAGFLAARYAMIAR